MVSAGYSCGEYIEFKSSEKDSWLTQEQKELEENI